MSVTIGQYRPTVTHDALPPVAACLDVPAEYDAGSPRAAAERLRREPLARAVAEALYRHFRSGRTDARYHVVATFDFAPTRDGRVVEAGWRPCRAPYDAAAIERMLLGEAIDRPTQRGLGLYISDERGRTDRIAIDIDAHKEGESAEVPICALLVTLGNRGIPHLLAKSKGGRGFHVWIRFDEWIPGRAARAFGAWLVREAGLNPKTEVFPKQDTLNEPGAADSWSKIAGSQIAIPGCLNFWAAKGGSTILDGNRDPVPFDRWVEALDSWSPVRVAALKHLSDVRRLDFWGERKAPTALADGVIPISSPRGCAPIENIDQLLAFLGRHGIEVAQQRGGHGTRWTDRLILRRCVNSAAHGSANEDGAAILFDSTTGRVGYKCWHASCEAYSWGSLLRGLGYQTEQRAPKGPPPEPVAVAPAAPPALLFPSLLPDVSVDLAASLEASAIVFQGHDHECNHECNHDHEEDEEEPDLHVEIKSDPRAVLRGYTKEAREALIRLSRDHFGPTSDTGRRLARCSACGRTKAKLDCDVHASVRVRSVSCGHIYLCPYCASRNFTTRRQQMLAKWPEKLVAITYRPGDSLEMTSPSAAHARMRRWLQKVRRSMLRRKIPKRRWFAGLSSFVVIIDDADERGHAKYVAGDLDHPAEIAVETISVGDAADRVFDVLMEPATTLDALCSRGLEGKMAILDFPFLVDDARYRCTGANKCGEKLFWPTDEEHRAQVHEEMRRLAVERGEDPEEADLRCCPIKHVNPDGTKRRCGRLLRPRIYVDDVRVHDARYGAPGWSAIDDGILAWATEGDPRRGVP